MERTDWGKIKEVLKKSEAGDIQPPKERKTLLGLRTLYQCPQCNQGVKRKFFKEVWIIGLVIAYQFFECLACGWQYAREYSKYAKEI